ncbi:MAG: hypothetical protein WC071_07925, partial [Victivallaceae bacterium]
MEVIDDKEAFCFAFFTTIIPISSYFVEKFKCKNWCHPVIFYLITFIIVYFQVPYIYLWGGELDYYVTKNICDETVGIGLIYTSISINFFLCGLLVSWHHIKSKIEIKINFNFTIIERIITVGALLDICIYVLFVYYAGENLYMNQRYSDDMYMDKNRAMLFLGIHMQIISVLIALQGYILWSRKTKNLYAFVKGYDKLLLLAIFFSTVFFLINGARVGFLSVYIPLIASYFLVVKPLRFTYMLLLLTLGICFLAIMGKMRNDRNEFSLSLA